MRIIGIDPGSRVMGWGVVDREGTRMRHVAHGLIKPNVKQPLVDRLVTIDDELAAVLAEQRPDDAAVESIFFSKNAQSAATLGHARGVVLLRLRKAGLDVFEYPPAQVKRTVTGRGRADKHQVAMIVAAALRLPEPPPSDAADALAVAFTHLSSAGFREAMARSGR